MAMKIFNPSNVPNIENLPITRHVVELMNEANSTNTYDALRATMAAMVTGIAELESQVKSLTEGSRSRAPYAVSLDQTEP